MDENLQNSTSFSSFLSMLNINIYYSKFDKDQFKDFHKAQSKETTPLALDNF